MSSFQKQFVLDCGKQRVGPRKAYGILAEIQGGRATVGCSVKDFENSRRDMLLYYKGIDSQVVLDRFALKKKCSNAFYYAYSVGKEKKLERLFWCDAIGRRNCSVFGDVVSFDSTYNTNK